MACESQYSAPLFQLQCGSAQCVDGRDASDSHIYPDLRARRYPRLLYRTLGDANEGANVSKIVGPGEERAVEDEQ
jgi:hypothetical protein